MPDNTVYVGRPTIWGNPFTVAGAIEAGYAEKDAPNMAVYAFKQWLLGNPDYPENPRAKDYILTHLYDLRGKNLACFCKEGQPCHADVLLEMANG